MKKQITLKEFKQNHKDSISNSLLSEFMINCSLDDFISLINDSNYQYEYYYFDIKEDNEILGDFLNHFQKPLKFKMKVKFKNKEIYKEIILLFDSYRIALTKDSKLNMDKGKSELKGAIKYTIEHIRKKKNPLKEKIYNLILDKYSLNNPIILRKGSYYEENDYSAFYKAYKTMIDVLKNDLINDSNWLKLNDRLKKELFFSSLFLHMQLNTGVYSTLSKYLDNSFHFGPVRETPKYSYKLKNNKFDKTEYYGLLDIMSGGKNQFAFYQLESFLQNLKIGKSIFTEFKRGEGKIKFRLNDNTVIDLADAPSGLIQLFPILGKIVSIGSLFSKFIRERFSIEQPELHLHPKLQTKLTEFLANTSKNNNLIIETHSEHIIRKLQVMFAKGEITDADVNINYFDNKNGKTKIKKMEMDENGFFIEPWPDGFFDENLNLTEELLFAPKNN